jgi:hypothetical protein
MGYRMAVTPGSDSHCLRLPGATSNSPLERTAALTFSLVTFGSSEHDGSGWDFLAWLWPSCPPLCTGHFGVSLHVVSEWTRQGRPKAGWQIGWILPQLESPWAARVGKWLASSEPSWG